jgi:NDP-sugar pyrophosphorylase family protein
MGKGITTSSVRYREELLDTEVILQAGGKGQRIQPLSERQPKPLLSICGMPMIERLFRQLVSAGFINITVITGYGRDAIVEHIQSLRKGLPGKIRVRFHHEAEPQGNVGALSEIDTGRRRALLVFADLVTDLDFVHLLKIHLERACSITLTSHYEHYRLRLGEINVAGAQVTDYQEKPARKFLACSGIAVLEPAVIAVAHELPRPFGISDLVRQCLDSNHSVTHWRHGAFWLDINTEAELQAAESKLATLLARKCIKGSLQSEVLV